MSLLTDLTAALGPSKTCFKMFESNLAEKIITQEEDNNFLLISSPNFTESGLKKLQIFCYFAPNTCMVKLTRNTS